MGKTKTSGEKATSMAENKSKTPKFVNKASIDKGESNSDSDGSENLSPPPSKTKKKMKLASAEKSIDEPIPSTSKAPSTKRLKFSPEKKLELQAETKPELQAVNYADFPEPDGLQILITMSNEDRTELLERIQAQCPQDDRKQVYVREGEINWDDVSFSLYGPEQCKAIWSYLTNRTRKYRIAHEIIEEVKFNLKVDYKKFIKKIVENSDKFPQRPYATGGFQLFCRESFDKHKQQQLQKNAKVDNFLVFQSECFERWNKVPEDRKTMYTTRAHEIRAKHQQKVKEFYAKYPSLGLGSVIKSEDDEKPKKEKTLTKYGVKKAQKLSKEIYKDAPAAPLTPLKLFVNSKLNKLNPPPLSEEMHKLKVHFCDRYKALSNKKKCKWVDKCIREQEQYMDDVREYKKAHPMFLLPNEFQISKLLSRDEFSIYEEIHGKPPKPKSNVFEVFLEEFTNSEEIEGTPEEVRKIAVAKFDSMDWYQKELYTIQFKSENLSFRKNMYEYFNNLPESLKPMAMDNIPKKYHKYLLENVGKDPMTLDDDANAADASTPKKQSEEDRAATGTEETEQDSPDPKKKKKKKKKAVEDEEGTPLYMLEITEEQKKLIEEKVNDEKESKRLKKTRKAADDDMDESESLFQNYGRSIKPKASSFKPGDTITTHDLNEAVRGIFDGNQHLGRKFSVFYYYAKYVGIERHWKSLYKTVGVLESAGRIIETFRNLGKHQQEIFIRESYGFYKTRYYGNKLLNESDLFTNLSSMVTCFPDEPKLPPRNAELLYSREMTLKKLQNPDINVISWYKLDESIQMYYIKKLREVTKDYVVAYERFVKNMTPNDLVEYVVAKRYQWEHHRKFQLKPQISVYENFSRVTHSAELSEDGQESEPEMHASDVSDLKQRLKCLTTKYKHNPFATKSRRKAKRDFVRKLLTKKQQIKLQDSDEPSSSEDDSTNLLLPTKFKRQREVRRRMKKLEKYYYPLDDICDLPSLQSAHIPMTVKQRIYEAQTELLKQALAVKNNKSEQPRSSKPRIRKLKRAAPNIAVIRESFQRMAEKARSTPIPHTTPGAKAIRLKRRRSQNTSNVGKGVEMFVDTDIDNIMPNEYIPTLALVNASPERRRSGYPILEPVTNYSHAESTLHRKGSPCQNINLLPDSTDLVEAAEHYIFDANDVVDCVGDMFE